MKKLITNLSLLAALSVSACDYYKNHDQPVSQINKCDPTVMNNNCASSVFDVAKNEEENKKERKLPEPEVQVAKFKNCD